MECAAEGKAVPRMMRAVEAGSTSRRFVAWRGGGAGVFYSCHLCDAG